MTTRVCAAVVVTMIAACVLACPGLAQIVHKQVVASVSYEPHGILGNTVPPTAYEAVKKEARRVAYAKYLAEDCIPAQRQTLEAMRTDIDAEFDAVVPEVQQLGEARASKAAKQLEISAKVAIDESKIKDMVKRKTAINAGATPATSTDRPPLVFVFVARKIDEIATSSGKTVTFNKNSNQRSEALDQKAGTDGVSVDSSSENLSTQETGGKVVAKAQQVTWTVESVSAVDAAVNETFAQAGYETTDPADVPDFNVQSFRDDYATGDDITAETRRAANATLKGNEVGLFATGHLDITLPRMSDQAQDLYEVDVRIEAKISDLRPKLPKTVAAVSGAFYKGVGPNPQVATQNALLTAARKASSDLVSQLQSKGL